MHIKNISEAVINLKSGAIEHGESGEADYAECKILLNSNKAEPDSTIDDSSDGTVNDDISTNSTTGATASTTKPTVKSSSKLADKVK